MFDRYVEAQARPAGSRARHALVVVSVAVHAVAIVGLIIYSFVHVEEVPPPLLTVTFFSASAPPPPPPPPPPAGKKKPTPTKKQTLQPTKVQPLVQPKEPEKEKEEEEEEKGGVEGGVEGGVAGGVVGGVLGSTAPVEKPPPPPPPPKPKNVAHEPNISDYVSRELPHLSDAIKSQRKGSETVFAAKMCFKQDGTVLSVTTFEGIPGADDGIIRVLKTWQLKPQPIPICFPLRLEFMIE